MAKSSDAYLQSVLSLDRFQRSECGYVFPKRNFPTLDTVWMTEVLPVFQPQARNELAMLWPQIKARIVNATKKSTHDSTSVGMDKKTECGFEASMRIGDILNFRLAAASWDDL